MNGLEQEYGSRLKVIRVNIRNKDTLPLQERFGFSVTPEFFLVDSSGKVVGYWDEASSLDNLKADIDRIMAGKP